MGFSFARRCNFARERAGRHLPLSSSIDSVRPVAFPPGCGETADEANPLGVGDGDAHGREGWRCLRAFAAKLAGVLVTTITFRRSDVQALVRDQAIVSRPPSPGAARFWMSWPSTRPSSRSGKLPSSPATVCVGVSRNPLPSSPTISAHSAETNAATQHLGAAQDCNGSRSDVARPWQVIMPGQIQPGSRRWINGLPTPDRKLNGLSTGLGHRHSTW
jgi:hypothetical protein